MGAEETDPGALGVAIAGLWLLLIVALFWRLRRRRGRIGAGAQGAVYDMLNEDKRRAIELIVEGRAEERDGEHADGDLPKLERPK